MCGIVGIINSNYKKDEILLCLRKMADSIIHRGPDEEGYFAANGVGLGIRRLSIIDVKGGQQPISNEDGSVKVVFNGEIYNFIELREKLESRGHTFHTLSDTEVIAHLYEEKGIDFLKELRGMFAIAIWDKRNERLILARDRLGKKPLFFSYNKGIFLFGSEIKTILKIDAELLAPNPEAIIPYFKYGFVPEPFTMFLNIHKLPAAHYLIFEKGEINTDHYWKLNYEISGKSKLTEDWIEELDAMLEEAVRIRLMSEVPLGIFLSGGLDSSTIVAYAHKVGLNPIKTFTIGFDVNDWDESEDAKLVADHFGTEHNLLTLKGSDLAANLPATLLEIVGHFDEPFGDPSSLPTYYVSKLAREHVTVMLSGDGGDELFAGYSQYKGMKFSNYYKKLPQRLREDLLPRIVTYVASLLPLGQRYTALRFSKILRDSSLPFDLMYFNKMAICPPEIIRNLFNNDFYEIIANKEQDYVSADIISVLQSDLPMLNKISYADFRFRLLEDMLVKVDRMSMAHSLEVRCPLLDHRLVEFVVKMPFELKMRAWENKAILRDTVRRFLPAKTLQKKKKGFSVPLREWFRTSLREMVGDYLGGEKIQNNIFNLNNLNTILKKHYNGEADFSSVIWLLLNYQAWQDLYKVPNIH